MFEVIESFQTVSGTGFLGSLPRMFRVAVVLVARHTGDREVAHWGRVIGPLRYGTPLKRREGADAAAGQQPRV
jgi:hypothetical protein